jgi:antirestriction protein ArdC
MVSTRTLELIRLPKAAATSTLGLDMSASVVPWHKPWKASTGLPRNLITNQPYRGINVFLLMSMSYESPHWLTFRQAIQLGGSVKKGEKACPIVFWKQTTIEDKETEEQRKIPMLRLYHVFNVAQCEGLKAAPAAEAVPLTATSAAEIVAGISPPSSGCDTRTSSAPTAPASRRCC